MKTPYLEVGARDGKRAAEVGTVPWLWRPLTAGLAVWEEEGSWIASIEMPSRLKSADRISHAACGCWEVLRLMRREGEVISICRESRPRG